MAEATLPEQFSELEPYVPIWAKPTVDERVAARGECSMEEITAFYDAAIVRAEEALNYLDQFDVHDMPEPAANLLKLMLGLVQASVSVEIQRQPSPPNTTFPLHVSLMAGAEPFGTAQG